ncbi:hypothetical protein OB955_14725 [Halobacteria archaeon AArc-m2/3/4]|uniref:Uncharacterized protein n=1 Tax=Natronoglomus mannanivorans TaxID=2979990 RepID=A0ABT2QGC7_9EURY|nr:hypothetical protein [Halobacteria archaeon AArc-m2/3/4]
MNVKEAIVQTTDRAIGEQELKELVTLNEEEIVDPLIDRGFDDIALVYISETTEEYGTQEEIVSLVKVDGNWLIWLC